MEDGDNAKPYFHCTSHFIIQYKMLTCMIPSMVYNVVKITEHYYLISLTNGMTLSKGCHLDVVRGLVIPMIPRAMPAGA
jgi:hypothetical protein